MQMLSNREFEHLLVVTLSFFYRKKGFASITNCLNPKKSDVKCKNWALNYSHNKMSSNKIIAATLGRTQPMFKVSDEQ